MNNKLSKNWINQLVVPQADGSSCVVREEEQEGGQLDCCGHGLGIVIPLIVIFKDFSLSALIFMTSAIVRT